MARVTLWVFVVLVGLDLGAGLYETRVVVPLWTAGVPGTLAPGNPYGLIAARAGLHFWAVLSPLVAIATVLALVAGFRAPRPQFTWRLVATILELIVVASTLAYFAPTARRLLMTHGAGLDAASLTSVVHRWVVLNRVRVAVTAVAWAAGLGALVK
ncbi:MAG TPA: hypothetical protein VFX12_15790 [Vicinamibacterales bacterium]|nr:hypothetical protein [Vicinamibacterales bacterium]